MGLGETICKELGIPRHYVLITNEATLILVHRNWLRSLLENGAIPLEFIRHENMSDVECQVFLQEQNDKNSDWKILEITVIVKSDLFSRMPSINKLDETQKHGRTFSELLDFISKTNYQARWRTNVNTHTSDYNKKLFSCQEKLQPFSTVICETLRNLYGHKLISLNGLHDTSVTDKEMSNEFQCHENILPAICILESTCHFYIVQNRLKYSLYDCIRFSPNILNSSNVKPLFLIYQLLYAICYLHERGLCAGDVNLTDVRINCDLWLQLRPKFWEGIHTVRHSCVSNDNDETASSESFINQQSIHMSKEINVKSGEMSDISNLPLNNLVEMWIRHEISNFDYIMALNHLAGRQPGNPNNHPVLPWVIDFSVPNGGWRDLTKSKFRLNKGDHQLDLTYEPVSHMSTNMLTPNCSATPLPHHVSDVLSEITYYVYKARCTNRNVLCRYVRPNWVPEEYPSSMQRLYDWTPDECIPEFYTDPTIFHSIHDDLQDLEIPWWAASPEDFISKHKAIFDGEYVSSSLHHWIDLTFGFKLLGPAAIEAKNVCLQLVDNHTNLRNGGIIQLFNKPHPHRLTTSLSRILHPPECFSKNVQRQKRQQQHDASSATLPGNTSQTDVDNSLQKLIDGTKTFGFPDSWKVEYNEDSTFNMPKDFNPLITLNQIETFCLFTGRPHELQEIRHQNEQSSAANFQDRKARDLVAAGCIIVELFLAHRLREVYHRATLDDRCKYIHACLSMHFFELPSCVRKAVAVLLNFNILESAMKSPQKVTPVIDDGLPQPSAYLLLQPFVKVLPFPPYFSDFYIFLREMKLYIDQVASHSNRQSKFWTINLSIKDWAEEKIKKIAAELKKLLPKFNEESFDLVLPYVKEIFEYSETSILAAWYLFNMVSQALGPQLTCKHLIQPLTQLYDAEYPTAKHMKLYHHSYLLQLIIRLGLKTFLTHFTTLLVEAVGGYKDVGSNEHNYASKDSIWKNSKLKFDLDLIVPGNGNSQFESNSSIEDSKMGAIATVAWQNEKFENGGCFSTNVDNITESEAEIFIFEPAFEDVSSGTKSECLAVDHEHEECSTNYIATKNVFNAMEENVKDCIEPVNVKDCIAINTDNKDFHHEFHEEMKPSSYSEGCQFLKLKIYPDIEQRSSSVPHHSATYMTTANLKQEKVEIDANLKHVNSTTYADEQNIEALCGNCKISGIAAESLIWLSHRVGPVLTAKFLSRNLLRMLSLCYLSDDQLDVYSENLDDRSSTSDSFTWNMSCQLVGDKSSKTVLQCLKNIAELYGENFIILQYFPHMTETVMHAKRHLTPGSEAGLISNLALLSYFIPYLIDSTLMDHLNDIILEDILFPTLILVSSLNLTFPSGLKGRQTLAYKFVDTLILIGQRIGADMSIKHLTGIIKLFFKNFSTDDTETLSVSVQTDDKESFVIGRLEVLNTFTQRFAQSTYIKICKVVGRTNLEEWLESSKLVNLLLGKHEKDKNMYTFSSKSQNESRSFDGTHVMEGSSQPLVIGNRIAISTEDYYCVNDSSILNTSCKQIGNGHRHLKGNWLAYWEHEIGRSDKDIRFNFNQIKLQTFVGHYNAVRNIQVLDNENSFISASKDKTVKLWSLRSNGDGSSRNSCQCTYNNHKKSVFSVAFLESLRYIASCDSTIHVWDPFMGTIIKQFDSPKHSPVTVLSAMPAPSSILISATTDGLLRFLDVRILQYLHEYKVTLSSAGLIRCVSVSPNGLWIAIGHSSGIISVLDTRTGLIRSTWKGHEGEVLQLKAFNNCTFVTSSLDQNVAVWNADDGKLCCYLRGPSEPVHCFGFYQGEMISGTTANRIGVHTSVDNQACFTSTRLRSDTFKGVLTCLSILPLNRLLLLGADNGTIRLLC